MRTKRASEINEMIGMELKKYGISEVWFKEDFTFTLANGESFTPNHLVCYEKGDGRSHVSVVGNEIVRETGKSFTCINYNKFTTPQKMKIVSMIDMNTINHHEVRVPKKF